MSLLEAKRFIENADQSDLYRLKESLTERQKVLDDSKKTPVIIVMIGSFIDSYYSKDNKNGALDRLYAIVSDERYRKNPDRAVRITESLRTEEELKVIKDDKEYFESGFPTTTELPML